MTAAAAVSAEGEVACRQVVIAFAHHLDHREFDAAAELFAPDGVWDRHGETLVGRDAIREVIASRDPNQLERHVTTTTLSTSVSPTECSVISYVQIYRTTAAAEAETPMVATSMLGEFHDTLRMVDGEWKLAHRFAVAVMKI
jgi:hypothetical protein